jgi:hypothetical protein
MIFLQLLQATKPSEESSVHAKLDFLCQRLFPASADPRVCHPKSDAKACSDDSSALPSEPYQELPMLPKLASSVDSTTEELSISSSSNSSSGIAFKRPSRIRSGGSYNKSFKLGKEPVTQKGTTSNNSSGSKWLNSIFHSSTTAKEYSSATVLSKSSIKGEKPTAASLDPEKKERARKESEDESDARGIIRNSAKIRPGFFNPSRSVQPARSIKFSHVDVQSCEGASDFGQGASSHKGGLFEEMRIIMEDVVGPMKSEVSSLSFSISLSFRQLG